VAGDKPCGLDAESTEPSDVAADDIESQIDSADAFEDVVLVQKVNWFSTYDTGWLASRSCIDARAAKSAASGR
jgi:hypothetical protein